MDELNTFAPIFVTSRDCQSEDPLCLQNISSETVESSRTETLIGNEDPGMNLWDIARPVISGGSASVDGTVK